MKKEELSAAMTYIDEKFIDEAENYNMKTRKFVNKRLSKVIIAAIITAIAVFGCVAYAGISYTDWDAFISFYNKNGEETKISVSDSAFFKDLPEDIPVLGESDPKIPMSENQLEETLGFDVLGSNLSQPNTTYYYSTLKNKKSNDVAKVHLYCPYLIKENETKHVDMLVNILGRKAEEGFILPFIEGVDAAGGKVFIEEYYIPSLSVKSVIYTYEDVPESLNVTFVYDNIYYQINSENYSLSELKEVLSSLEN